MPYWLSLAATGIWEISQWLTFLFFRLHRSGYGRQHRGRGASSTDEVSRARDTSLDRDVAIMVLTGRTPGLLRSQRKDHVWAYDFVHHRRHDGRAMRLLTIVDEYTRESLAIDVARKLNCEDVLERLGWLLVHRGIPEHIRSDNGPEFTAQAVRDWLGRLGVGTLLIEPGSPWDNGYVGELQRQAQRRTARWRDLLHAQGGKGSDREMETAVQPHATAQLAGLSAARTRSDVVEAGYAPLRRPQHPLVSTELLR